MKVIFSPKKATPQNMRDLKLLLRKNGIKTIAEVNKPTKGELGRGIASGLAAILAGGDGFFTKIGEAIVKFVELKKVDVSMKNGKGEEITLSAALPKDQVRIMINEFFDRKLIEVQKPKNEAKKTDKKIISPKKASTKTKTTKKTATNKLTKSKK